MNKGELVDYIAEEMESSKVEANRFVDTFVQAIQENIVSEDIRISGIGTFSRTKRKARTGRNPQTGEEIKIPARWAVTFKAGTSLKERVQKKK